MAATLSTLDAAAGLPRPRAIDRVARAIVARMDQGQALTRADMLRAAADCNMDEAFGARLVDKIIAGNLDNGPCSWEVCFRANGDTAYRRNAWELAFSAKLAG